MTGQTVNAEEEQFSNSLMLMSYTPAEHSLSFQLVNLAIAVVTLPLCIALL